MLDKVITILIVSICFGTGNMLPQGTTNPATQNVAMSSVRFQREDVPLVYNYNLYHRYPSPHELKETTVNYHINTKMPPRFQSIQYAPLEPELQYKNSKFAKLPMHKPHDLLDASQLKLDETQKKERKKLEPRLEKSTEKVHSIIENNLATRLDYIPGHNIEVLRSINRSPGHNAVYRSYIDETANKDKQNKNHFLNQHNPNKFTTRNWTTNSQITTTTTNTPTTITVTATPKITEMKIIQKYAQPIAQPHEYYQPYPLEKNYQEPDKSQHTKVHALLLNVARTYNLGLVPLKSSHTKSAYSPRLFEKTLMKVPGSLNMNAPLPQQKTLLYPVQKNLHFALHS